MLQIMETFGKQRSWLVVAMLSLSLAVISLTSCSREKPKSGNPVVPVLVAKAVETNVPVQVSAIGNVMAYSRVSVRSQITGQLREIHFKEGQSVHKGEPLFTIDSRPAQAAQAQAQANLARDTAQMENAKIQFSRVQKLFADKVASQEEFDTSKANLDALAGTDR